MPNGSLPDGPTGPPVTLLVGGGTVVTMDAERRVLADAAVAIAGDRIVAILPTSEALAAYPAARRIVEPDGIVTPGYVNAHQHLTGDRLIRSSIPDRITSEESIFSWAVPSHAAHGPEDDELSATLACVDALRNGVTTLVEAGTVAHPERVAAAMRVVGARGTIGAWGWDLPDGAPFVAPAAEVLERQQALLEAFPTGEARVAARVTLVGHDLVSDELLAGASDLACRHGAGLTFHISPHRRDAISYLERTGFRPVVHFARLGILGPHVLLAHAVHLDDEEVEAVVSTSTAVAHCPWAYLRLAQGVAVGGRHGQLMRTGRVALGCDSENAGDLIDVLRTAALAVGLERDRAEDPTFFDARLGLELATVRGAEAVGLAAVAGSLEVGKRADVVVHRIERVPAADDPVLELIWGTDGRSVVHVVVDGQVVVEGRACTTVDEAALAEEAAARHRSLLERAGLATVH